jgi:hypothetical protein
MAALSGANSGSFFLSNTMISSIAAGGTGAFTVVPKTGLAVGTRTVTVTVSGGNGIWASFTVSFTVNTVNTVPAGKIITAWVTAHTVEASALNAAVTRTPGVDDTDPDTGSHVTFTVTGTGYGTTFVWTVNNEVKQSGTNNSFDFNATWKSDGTYYIGLVVTKDSVQYSKEYTVTVTN